MLAATICAASLSIAQWRTPLYALSPKIWWLILPATLGLIGLLTLWGLPEGMRLYRY